LRRAFFQKRIWVGVAQYFKRGNACRGGQWISAQRAGLKHFACGQNVIHNISAATVSANRQSAADDFAERCEVRAHSEQRLCSAVRHAKSGHYLVQN
jgi:hypothetical protein